MMASMKTTSSMVAARTAGATGSPPLIDKTRTDLSHSRQYQGEFCKDRREGQGRFSWPNNDVFEGTYRNDMRDGLGKLTYANGTVDNGDCAANMHDTFSSLQECGTALVSSRSYRQGRASSLDP